MTGREKGEELKLPALVVFDLDDCCWYPALDEMAGEPYSSERPAGGEEGLGRVVDRRGHEIALFPGMRKILLELHSGAKWAQTKVATASRTHCVEAAAQVLGLMELGESGLVMKDIFHENQIYPGCKKKHFRRLQRDTGVAFEDMLFFDDWHGTMKKGGGPAAVSVSEEQQQEPDAEPKMQWEQSLSTEWSEEEGGARKLTVVLPKVGGWGAMSSEERADLTQQLQQREQQIDDTNRQIAARVEAAKQAAARQEAEERREKVIKERLERAEKAERARLEIEDSFSTMFDGLVRDFEKDWGLASSSTSSSTTPPPNLKPLTEEQVQQKERARLQKVLEAKRAEMQVDIATPTEEGYAAKVFLPEGLEKEDVTIKLEEDNATLVITTTHRQQQQEGEEGQGAAVRSRERRLRLAKDADVGAISASFVQGEAGEGGPEALSVAVPKMKPRTITIQ